MTSKTAYKEAQTRSQIWPVGKRIRTKDGLFVVTAIKGIKSFTDGLSFCCKFNDGFEYQAEYRPATAEEDAAAKKATQIKALELELAALTGPVDDYRDEAKRDERRNAVTAELQALR